MISTRSDSGYPAGAMLLNATAMHMETFRNSRAVRNAGSVLLPSPVSDIFLPAVCPQERGQVRIWSYTMTSQVPNAFYRAQSRPRLRLAMTRAWRPKRWTRRDRTWQGAASAQTRRQRKKSSRGGECGATSFCIRLNSFRYTANHSTDCRTSYVQKSHLYKRVFLWDTFASASASATTPHFIRGTAVCAKCWMAAHGVNRAYYFKMKRDRTDEHPLSIEPRSLYGTTPHKVSRLSLACATRS